MLSRLYCGVCASDQAHETRGANHVLHLLLAIVTGGLWIPVWILCALGLGQSSYCRQCGSRYQSAAGKLGIIIAAAAICFVAYRLMS